VAGAVSERAGLAPAGHPPVDEPRVARANHVGSDPQPLHDAGTKALDQYVRPVGQLEQGGAAGLPAKVENDRGPTPTENVEGGWQSRHP